jgi:ornithine carbamoyltransferase
MKKDLLSILDVEKNIEEILDTAIRMKNQKGLSRKPLEGVILAMLFEKASTRTRLSFEAGMKRMGGDALFLGKNDLQLGRGETIQDTALVLSRYVDIIMYRAFKSRDIYELAEYATVPVINGLDDKEHPCQVLADFMTIKEKKGELKDLNFVYMGDGDNNMAHSYLLGCPLVGMNIKIVSPQKYWPDPEYVDQARKMDTVRVEITEKKDSPFKDADIVATDTWVSMGEEQEKQQRLRDFTGYTIDTSLMKQAKNDAIFMHCLPAYYGKEVTKEVAHGPQSVIFDEAENRLWAQMASITHLLK